MLRVGKTFEEAVVGAQYGEAHLGAIDQGREALVMPLASLAEEHGLDGTARAQCFFDKAHAFNPNEAAFSGQAAAEGHAKLLEPVIVAAGKERGLPSGVVRRSAGH